MQTTKPLVLMILDGWGYRETNQYNAIALANTPQWDAWWQAYPHTLLTASGEEVGLPRKQMGNSEVGHMHIGAGRCIPQDFTRINEAISAGEFAHNPVFIKLLEDLKASKKTLHVMGLLSDGGVHSHEEHLFAFLRLCHAHKLTNICLHLFLDGRDTPPQSALDSIGKLNDLLETYPVAKIKSISGRYYAMDRDERWDRIAKVYDLLTQGQAEHQFATAKEAITASYAQEKTDEFILPTLIGDKQIIAEGDAIFFFNFRADRARQLCQAFLDEPFAGFIRTSKLCLSHFISMTPYSENLATLPAFPMQTFKNTLGEILAKRGLKQLRIAETEKYAHVTFFLNGGSEQVFANETRILIPSPAVETYDLSPEMSAPALTESLVAAIKSQVYDVIICNYANADMVGHSGNLPATVQAIQCLDRCMQEVGKAILKVGGTLLITADHGNAEVMFDNNTHQPHTAHTSTPVPLLYVSDQPWHFNKKNGSLIDIAPTLLALLGIEQPQEMTGSSLMVKSQ